MIGLEFDKVGSYGAVMGCWGQDNKSAGRGRKIMHTQKLVREVQDNTRLCIPRSL